MANCLLNIISTQVGFLTNMNETQCLCNHLTSFGGDFVVPPNSIDWDAVGAGFSNLDENPVVFAVVVSIIGVYFILLVWVRRLDKKDIEEVTIAQMFNFCKVQALFSLVTNSPPPAILYFRDRKDSYTLTF